MQLLTSRVTKGLNIEGTCTNAKCDAYRQRVVCKKGFVIFNLVDRHDNHCPACGKIVKATTCSFNDCVWMFEGRKATKPVPGEPKTTTTTTTTTSSRSLFRAVISNLFPRCMRPDAAGIVQGVEDAKKAPAKPDIVSPWYTAENRYEYFDDKDNVVEWESLVIIAKKRPSGIWDRPLEAGNLSTDVSEREEKPGSVISVGDSCPICFSRLASKKTHKTSCGHNFHKDCLSLWKASGGTTCPMCRVHMLSCKN